MPKTKTLFVHDSLPSSVFLEAWARVYSVFNERQMDAAVEVMDTVLADRISEYQDRIALIDQQIGEDDEED